MHLYQKILGHSYVTFCVDDNLNKLPVANSGMYPKRSVVFSDIALNIKDRYNRVFRMSW